MSDTFELRGRITIIHPAETRGANGFRVRRFVMDTEEPGAKWPNPLEFEQQKEDADSYIAMGPAVVRFAINGRFWEKGNRHFVTLKAFNVARDVSTPAALPTPQPAPTPTATDGEDNLPF
jgi:hypothetical protein